MSYRISLYDEDNPQLVLTIGKTERELSFSVARMPPEKQEWLGQILDRMFHEEIDYAVNKALNEHRAEMRKLLGIHP